MQMNFVFNEGEKTANEVTQSQPADPQYSTEIGIGNTLWRKI